MHYTRHQGSYFPRRITLEGVGDDALAQSLSTARVEMNPHQVDALLALGSPLSKGALLSTRSGCKTIEVAFQKAISGAYSSPMTGLRPSGRSPSQLAKIKPYKARKAD